MILGSYFVGYLVTSLPAGVIAEYFGPTIVVGITSGLSALITALSSLSASFGFWAFYANRFIIGVLGVNLLYYFILRIYSENIQQQIQFTFIIHYILFSYIYIYIYIYRVFYILVYIILYQNGHHQRKKGNL